MVRNKSRPTMAQYAQQQQDKADRAALIAAGVRKIRECGYSQVKPDNILTDRLFSKLFRYQLRATKEACPELSIVIDQLIGEIETDSVVSIETEFEE